MTVLQVCGIALSVLMFTLQAGKKSKGAVIAAGVLFFSVSLEELGLLFSFFAEQNSVQGRQYYKALMKALGIGIVCQFTAQLCRDAGEGTLASGVEFFGKVEIILLSVPMLRELLTLAREFSV